eukprot:COSAG05_NODE_514_length_9082_cov_6.915730_4_plen_71_part_00
MASELRLSTCYAVTLMMVLAGGHNKRQPVTAINVGEAIAAAAETTSSLGRTYELAGPHAYTMAEALGGCC